MRVEGAVLLRMRGMRTGSEEEVGMQKQAEAGLSWAVLSSRRGELDFSDDGKRERTRLRGYAQCTVLQGVPRLGRGWRRGELFVQLLRGRSRGAS